MAGIFGSAGSNASSASNANTTQGDLKGDVTVTSPPDDSISDIRFSPASDHLSVASWDNKVRIYEIDAQGQSKGVAMFEHEGPALNTCWSKDGQKVFGAGADKAARMLDLRAGHTTPQQATQVAAHEQPIRCIESFNPQGGGQMIATGSWDKTVKYWDLRSPQPSATFEAGERVYSMDVRNDQMLVVATSDRWIKTIDLRNPTTAFKQIQSPLKWQTRVVSTFIDGSGFAVGSIEGRCAIQYIDDKDLPNNFSFKCHRETPATDRHSSNVYAVNAISFHPIHGTFSTAGADGTFHFWDKDAKHRLKGYPAVGGTIACTDFNRTGSIFAYAVSYDWSKGYSGNNPQYPNKIMLHPVVGDECKPRPKTSKR